MWWTYRIGTPENIAQAARNTVLADWLFTTPAGIIQPATGLWLIVHVGYDLFEPWLVLTYGLYSLAFICWVPVVWLQIQVRHLAVKAVAEQTRIPEQSHYYMQCWFWLGWPAFIALVGVFYLMVAKPTF